MALIRRVSRLFTADMHAVLDQIEEPEIVLKQAIREMEEELARQRQRQKWLGTEIDSAAAKTAAFAELVRELDGKLDVCFASDDDTPDSGTPEGDTPERDMPEGDTRAREALARDKLARRLIRRKLETAKLAEQSEAKRAALVRQLEELEALLETNADRLEGMQQKAALVGGEAPGAAGCGEMRVSGIDDDDVEIAFLREKQARASS